MGGTSVAVLAAVIGQSSPEIPPRWREEAVAGTPDNHMTREAMMTTRSARIAILGLLLAVCWLSGPGRVWHAGAAGLVVPKSADIVAGMVPSAATGLGSADPPSAVQPRAPPS